MLKNYLRDNLNYRGDSLKNFLFNYKGVNASRKFKAIENRNYYNMERASIREVVENSAAECSCGWFSHPSPRSHSV